MYPPVQWTNTSLNGFCKSIRLYHHSHIIQREDRKKTLPLLIKIWPVVQQHSQRITVTAVDNHQLIRNFKGIFFVRVVISPFWLVIRAILNCFLPRDYGRKYKFGHCYTSFWSEWVNDRNWERVNRGKGKEINRDCSQIMCYAHCQLKWQLFLGENSYYLSNVANDNIYRVRDILSIFSLLWRIN